MAGYQLWSPWSPLDESLRWLRGTTPPLASKRRFRFSPCFLKSPSDLEGQTCFEEVAVIIDSQMMKTGRIPQTAGCGSQQTEDKKRIIIKPQPVRLIGLDSVFDRVITVQPPKRTGTFNVSDRSAFSKITSKEEQWPTELMEPQIEMIVAVCKKMLRTILLLYAIYKKFTFVLQHSQ